ncbi:MAG: hypothetical protein C0P74_013970 [Gammaproteobacteria bacterium]
MTETQELQQAIDDTKAAALEAANVWAGLRDLAASDDDDYAMAIISPAGAARLLSERGVILSLLEQLTGDYSAGEQTLAALRARALLQATRARQN